MFPADRIKCIARGTRTSLHHIIQALANTFFRISAGSDVKQPLIGCCVLDDCGCFSFNGQHYRGLALLEPTSD